MNYLSRLILSSHETQMIFKRYNFSGCPAPLSPSNLAQATDCSTIHRDVRRTWQGCTRRGELGLTKGPPWAVFRLLFASEYSQSSSGWIWFRLYVNFLWHRARLRKAIFDRDTWTNNMSTTWTRNDSLKGSIHYIPVKVDPIDFFHQFFQLYAEIWEELDVIFQYDGPIQVVSHNLGRAKVFLMSNPFLNKTDQLKGTFCQRKWWLRKQPTSPIVRFLQK